MPLIPQKSIAGRSLLSVIAIMTFLISLTVGIAFILYDASKDWTSRVGDEITVQIQPVSGRDIEADVAKAVDLLKGMPGILDVLPYSKTQSEKLLEPWLGSGLDVSELPIPRLLVIKINHSSAPSFSQVREKLAQELPSATLDDHGVWVSRLSTMARVLVFMNGFIFLLMLIAIGLAVTFATTGAMAGTRDIVSVLHLVGAHDSFISAEFRNHFLKLGLKGSLLGCLSALSLFTFASWVSAFFVAGPTGHQLEVMFGRFELTLGGYASILVIAMGIAALTGFISQTIVLRQLRLQEEN